jgi:hypothetical protein
MPKRNALNEGCGRCCVPLWANLQGALGTTPANIGKAFKDDLESFIKGKASAKAAG